MTLIIIGFVGGWLASHLCTERKYRLYVRLANKYEAKHPTLIAILGNII